jgi:hypothetical protein
MAEFSRAERLVFQSLSHNMSDMSIMQVSIHADIIVFGA